MFEKKIIIGSILGFIASAIGIIAVFFPDLLNLQKKKIVEIHMVVNIHDDTKKFQSLIDEIFEKKQLTHLNVVFCTTGMFTYPNGNTGYGFTDPYILPIIQNGENYEFYFPSLSISNDEISSEEIRKKSQEDDNVYPTGNKYLFFNEKKTDDSQYNASNSALEMIGDGVNGEECGEAYHQISGYFVPADEYFIGEATVRTFTRVSEQLIRLKDY